MKTFRVFTEQLKEGKMVKSGGMYMTPDFAKKIGAKADDGSKVKPVDLSKIKKNLLKKESSELQEITATIKIGSKKETKKFKSEDDLIAYVEKKKGEVLNVNEAVLPSTVDNKKFKQAVSIAKKAFDNKSYKIAAHYMDMASFEHEKMMPRNPKESEAYRKLAAKDPHFKTYDFIRKNLDKYL